MATTKITPKNPNADVKAEGNVRTSQRKTAGRHFPRKVGRKTAGRHWGG